MAKVIGKEVVEVKHTVELSQKEVDTICRLLGGISRTQYDDIMYQVQNKEKTVLSYYDSNSIWDELHTISTYKID